MSTFRKHHDLVQEPYELLRAKRKQGRGSEKEEHDAHDLDEEEEDEEVMKAKEHCWEGRKTYKDRKSAKRKLGHGYTSTSKSLHISTSA
jgi:hypothetical protein